MKIPCPLCTEEYEGRLAEHLTKHSDEQVAKYIGDLLKIEL